MKKFVVLTMLAAAVAALCLTGCSKSESDSVYEIILTLEGENSKIISSKDADAQNAYDQINAKLSDFSKEVESQWVEKGNADKSAKAKFTQAKDKLIEVVKESEAIINAIPSGSTGSFVISEALLLRKVTAGSGTETLDQYSFSIKYPTE